MAGYALIEEWRPITGFDGGYEVSNLGRVRSLPRRSANGRALKGKIFQDQDNRGYRQVCFRIAGKSRCALVHRMVAQAFIPNPDNLPVINHKNGIKTDNQVKNLEWCTHQENIDHAKELGLQRYHQGEAHGMARLTSSEVREILDWQSTEKAAVVKFAISRSQYYRIRRGEAWKHLAR